MVRKTLVSILLGTLFAGISSCSMPPKEFPETISSEPKKVVPAKEPERVNYSFSSEYLIKKRFEGFDHFYFQKPRDSVLFTDTVTFYYSIPQETEVNFTIYNVLGQIVEEIKGGQQKRGQYEINLAPDYPSGIYFIRISTSSIETTGKFALFKDCHSKKE